MAQNAIVTENQQPGNPASEWDINGIGDESIQGFATDISVNKGETVRFKIKTNASAYTIDIYRLGYYQGNGARKIGTGVITTTLPQTQPADLVDRTTGLIDCGNWSESAHWVVPSTAISGVYIAKLTRNDTRGASHIVFIVRDDASTSALYFQTSDATWQAYNAYGGNSLYVGNTSFPNGHAAKVSYNRPFYTRRGGGGGGAGEDWLFNAEYPMIRWLERNGYDITYTTNVDADRRGNLIKNHKVFLSVGHDEYWSAQQRSNVEAARNAGTHLAFFSGNEVYWKTRWEPSIDGSNTNYRTLVCYKEGTQGENVCDGKCDPLPNVWTGLWRDGCNYPNADGCNPENALTGQISWRDSDGSITVPSTYKNYRIWRNTSIPNLQNGQSATFPNGTIGYEWNYEQDNGKYPASRVTLSEANVEGSIHKLSLYRHSSGALVFGAGTVQWSWGLDANHDRAGTPIDSRMQQATVNLFADMGVQAGSLQTGLIASTPSSDVQPPATVITSPQNGGVVTPNSTITITGTVTENAGIIARVEVSTDGGATWLRATGTANWSFSWTPPTTGAYTIKSRAVDDLGNLETTATSTNTIQVSTNANCTTLPTATIKATSDCQGGNVALQLTTATGQSPYTVVINNQTYSNITVGQSFTAVSSSTESSIWGNTGTPVNTNDYDGQAVEIGVKFRSSQSGTITGIRFYRATGNTGTNTAHLWSATGTLLATATYQTMTASGWQEVRFTTPVTIQANTTYVASYFSSSGRYASSENFFATSGVTNGPLTALQSGVDGGNGVYRVGSSGFPTSSYQTSNYWVDVLFSYSNTNTSNTYTLTSITDNNGCNNTGTISTATVTTGDSGSQTFYEDLDKDGYGNGSKSVTACTAPTGYIAQAGDCNDNDASISPGATEVCDGKDNNCDGVTDEGGVCDVTPTPTDGPSNGPGGPILVVGTTANPFSRYFAEILRAEGLNSFAVKDIFQLTETDLANYDVVILGEMALTASHVTLFTNWVNAGGTLIAMRPDAQLAGLMGLTPVSGTLADRYLLVNTATQQGKGIVDQTIQYHGPANLYNLNGATMLARLYSSASAATNNPAVTIHDVGTNGGQAVAFAYDLARSIVYSRQGNPAWAGQERDGSTPIRSDDQFYGNASFDRQADYVDLNKVAIPQADEQQHLLANLILFGNMDKKPLPRFWFLPRGLKAAVVMTGDDHANGGTAGRFEQYKTLSPSNTADAVKSWRAIRGTSYIYPNSPLTNSQAQSYQAEGFEVSLHLNTNCADWTASSLNNFYTSQLQGFSSKYSSVVKPVTHRIHCLVWSDWSSGPKVEITKGGRLNATYYYWPGDWIQNRPGMFTSSGMPMRFADLDGTIVDNYQLPTQMTDESDQDYPDFIDALLDKALGPEGYYGVFCANMHTDNVVSTGSDAIINSAFARNVPVISAGQLVTWLDARNGSSFSSFSWSNNALNFSITALPSATSIEAMLPLNFGTSRFTSLRFNGSSVSTRIETIKGVQYVFFPAASGNYVAVYDGTACTPPTATLKATAADCQGNNVALQLTTATGQAPYTVVVNNQTYSNVVVGQNFATVPTTGISIWDNSALPANPNLNDGRRIEVGVKFRSAQSGTITGIRFYKGTSNTGTHVGNLWTATGTLLASATFQNETASGWQEVRFSSPVTIQANTTYVASYYSPNGGYANTGNFFTSTSVTSGPLTALQSGVDGPNGVYRYGTSGFPTSTSGSANYWVDVLFNSGTFTYTLTSITDNKGCENTGALSTATFTPGSGQSGTQTFYRDADNDGYGNVAVTTIGCTAPAGYVAQAGDCNDNDANIKPGEAEVCDSKDNNCDGVVDEGCNLFYRDFDNDGFGDPNNSTTAPTIPTGYVSNRTDCKDSIATVYPGAPEVCNNGIDDNCDGRVDESCPGSTEESIWGNTGFPNSPNDYDGQTIEVGVKFRSAQSGTITGIRFYKGTSNTGTHVGNLWTATGTLLASATFQNETASGWQEVRFSSPVTIQANTTYVASYFSGSGRYASSLNYFATSGVTNGPLTALQSGVDGPNGVYKYGTSGFPTSSYRASNYWVDVLFKPSAGAAIVSTSKAVKEEQSSVEQKLSIQAIPNPTSSYFTLYIQGADHGPVEVRITDAYGRTVEIKRGVTANSSLQIGKHYRPGTYYLQAIQGGEKVVAKLIKLAQ